MDIRELESIAKTHEFTQLAQRLETLASEEVTLSVGVLGEFSAGKSSLINALLGKELLPVSDKPTTGAITLVELGAADQEVKFLIERNGERNNDRKDR